MKSDIDAIWEKLKTISEEIDREAYRRTKQHGESGWGGAGVVFTKDPPGTPKDAAFYPDLRYVVTPFANDAAWLLKKLRDVFSRAALIDSCSKFEFFGRLASAAIRYQKKTRSQTAQGLLKSMLREAELMLSEMEKGNFRDRAARRKKAVADDLEL